MIEDIYCDFLENGNIIIHMECHTKPKTLTQINASFHHYIDLTFRISDKLGFNRKRIPVHIMLYFLLRFGALPIHNNDDLRTLENLNLLV